MSTVRPSFPIRTVLVLTLLGISGCAAVRAGVQIQDAQSARDTAVEKGANTVALFEFTMAERYLEKAWEEMGTGAYKSSVALSRKSAEWSDQAVVQMKRGNRGVQVDLTTIDNTPPPKPDQPPKVEIIEKVEIVPEVEIVPKEPELEPDDIEFAPTAPQVEE